MLRKIGLFSRRALAKASSPHGIPIDRIMLVLQQVRRFFAAPGDWYERVNLPVCSRYHFNFRSRISPTRFGLALPLLSFITWPLRKFSAATLPAL